MTRDNAKFRSRKIDPKRALPVYLSSNFNQEPKISRAIQEVSTGVEKEEEKEHHLQAAISSYSAQHTSGSSKLIYIPTPETKETVYEKLNDYVMPLNLIKFSLQVHYGYCLDEQDLEWLKTKNITEDDFESYMFAFESVVQERGASINMLDFLPSFEEMNQNCPKEVYDYWVSRKQKQKYKSLMPQIKTEELKEFDPFVCFRKLETKFLRKTRRTDSQAMAHLRRLRQELETARCLSILVNKRELLRLDTLIRERVIFEKRFILQSLKRELGITEEQEYERLDSSMKLFLPVFQESPKKEKLKRPKYSFSIHNDLAPLVIGQSSRPKEELLPLNEVLNRSLEEEYRRKKRQAEDYEDLSVFPVAVWNTPIHPSGIFQPLLPLFPEIQTKRSRIESRFKNPFYSTDAVSFSESSKIRSQTGCFRRVGRGGRVSLYFR